MNNFLGDSVPVRHPSSTSGTLPQGWSWTTIAETCDVNPSVERPTNLSADAPVTFVPMAALDEKDGTIARPEVRRLGQVWAGYKRFAKGDVLFAKITPCMENGKVAIAEALVNDLGLGSTEFHVLRPQSGVLSKWVFYWVRQGDFRKAAQRSMTGTAGQLRVPASFVTRAVIPLAPLPEQQRIIDAIEEQFTRLDTAMLTLTHAQAALRRYRASVLKAACEGRLVPQDPADEPASQLLARILAERRARWEEAQRAKGRDPSKLNYEEPAAPDTAGMPDLPSGWCWVSLAQVSWDADYGTSQKCRPDISGPPVIRIPNVVGGEIDVQDLKYATDPAHLNPDDSLQPNDLVIVRTNGSRDLIGRSALVRHPLDQTFYFASYLIRFRVVPVEGLARWLASIWNAPFLRQSLERRAATTAGQYNLSITTLNRLPIPLPPLRYLSQCPDKIEECLSQARQLEVTSTIDLKRAERLRQAILKRAFAGQLLPQDPADEPAQVLLERIRAEREQRTAVQGSNHRQPRLPGVEE